MTEVLFAYPANTPEYQRALRSSGMGWKGRLLCMVLSTHGLRNTWAQDLAGEMGVSTNTVTSAKREAVSAGWLKYVHHGGGGDGGMLHDEFDLTMPLPELSDEPVKQSQEVGEGKGDLITGDVNGQSQLVGEGNHRSCEPEIEPEIEVMTTTPTKNPNVQPSYPAGEKSGVDEFHFPPMKPKHPKNTFGLVFGSRA
jgi:hypothetical protein